jgi:hypothetical protein
MPYIWAPVVPDTPILQVKKLLPFSVLSNCYAYVKHVYPSLPPTKTILANLSSSGEVAIFYFPDSNLYHYAVVEIVNPLVVTDTNYQGHKKTTREDSGERLIGFYKIH